MRERNPAGVPGFRPQPHPELHTVAITQPAHYHFLDHRREGRTHVLDGLKCREKSSRIAQAAYRKAKDEGVHQGQVGGQQARVQVVMQFDEAVVAALHVQEQILALRPGDPMQPHREGPHPANSLPDMSLQWPCGYGAFERKHERNVRRNRRGERVELPSKLLDKMEILKPRESEGGT